MAGSMRRRRELKRRIGDAFPGDVESRESFIDYAIAAVLGILTFEHVPGRSLVTQDNIEGGIPGNRDHAWPGLPWKGGNHPRAGLSPWVCRHRALRYFKTINLER